MRVFILECPSPIEILSDISERKPLEYICKTMGHEVYTFHIKSKDEFRSHVEYISSIDKVDRDESKDTPICIHISAHGNDSGVQFGKDFAVWDEMQKTSNQYLKHGLLKRDNNNHFSMWDRSAKTHK